MQTTPTPAELALAHAHNHDHHHDPVSAGPPPPPKPSYFIIVMQWKKGGETEYKAGGYGYDSGVFHFIDLSGGVHFHSLKQWHKVHVVPMFDNDLNLTFDQVESMGGDGTRRT